MFDMALYDALVREAVRPDGRNLVRPGSYRTLSSRMAWLQREARVHARRAPVLPVGPRVSARRRPAAHVAPAACCVPA